MDVTEQPRAARPDRTLIAVLVAVGLLVLLALVVVVVRNASTATLDATTPEGVVQRYAQAVIDGDDETASGYLVSQSDECEYYGESDRELRLALRSTETSGQRSTVRVSVTTSYGGGPFSSSEYTTDEAFQLVKSGDDWMIEETPYEFISCPRSATD
jgi:hypothetical protein